jgi:surfeit locus 1 family protein
MIQLFFAGRRLWLTLLVVCLAAACVRLGIWQLDRLAQRRALNATIDARMAQPALLLDSTQLDPQALDYRRVEVRGVYDAAQEIVLRNRELDGVPGVHVLTPLRLRGHGAGSGNEQAAVLVDRGWLPIDRAGPEDRGAYAAAAGEVVVQGIARRTQTAGGPAEPPLVGGQPRRDAWFRVDTAQIAQQTGYPLLPIFVEQQPAPDDPALPRRTPTADLGPGPHLSYAIQWFGFALILLAGYPAFVYQRVRGARPRPSAALAADYGAGQQD